MDKDLTGHTFSHLFVLGLIGTKKNLYGKVGFVWECQCVCGKKIKAVTSALEFKRVRSCGCKRRGIGNQAEFFVDYVKIKLNGLGDFFAIVDHDQYEKIRPLVWCKHQMPQSDSSDFDPLVYAISNIPGGGQIKMHQLIIACPPGSVRDHVDGNGLDNRKHNLRIASYSQNSKNRHKIKPNFQDGL